MPTPKSTNVVTPEIPSGFPHYRNAMMLAFLALTIIYFAVVATFPTIASLLSFPPTAPEYCKNDERQQEQQQQQQQPCYRGDLLSFEIVSGIALMYCAWVGFYAWHVTDITKSIPATPEGRLFGYIGEAHKLTAVGTTFQVFDLFISLLIPEQRQLLMLSHHIMAGTVSWYGLNNQYFHYYGVFYLGCSEISTIPLVFIDIAKFFPPVPGTAYDIFMGTVCGPLFAVTFFYYRVYLWWKVGFLMFSDIAHVRKNGMADRLRPGRNHVLYVMMALNLALGCLQLFWFGIVLQEAAKVLKFSDANATGEKSHITEIPQ